MTDNSKNKLNKQTELKKYRDLVLAAIDYSLEKHSRIRTKDFDSQNHYMKIEELTKKDD